MTEKRRCQMPPPRRFSVLVCLLLLAIAVRLYKSGNVTCQSASLFFYISTCDYVAAEAELDDGADLNADSNCPCGATGSLMSLVHGQRPSKVAPPGESPLQCVLDPNNDRFTSGRLALIHHLLDRGADVNAANRSGLPPMYMAIDLRRSDVVTMLAKHGANVNPSNPTDTGPLGLAVAKNDVPTVRALLIAGADPHAGALPGPLAYAVRHGQFEVSVLLIAYSSRGR